MSVPLLALSSGDFLVRFLVAVLGAVAALAAGFINMYQSRNQWLDYRSTAESLKFEKHMFLTRTAPYAAEDAFPLFVQAVETIIITENKNWQNKSFNLPQETSDSVSDDSSTDAVGKAAEPTIENS